MSQISHTGHDNYAIRDKKNNDILGMFRWVHIQSFIIKCWPYMSLFWCLSDTSLYRGGYSSKQKQLGILSLPPRPFLLSLIPRATRASQIQLSSSRLSITLGFVHNARFCLFEYFPGGRLEHTWRGYVRCIKEVLFKKEHQLFNRVNMSIQNLLIRARVGTALI